MNPITYSSCLINDKGNITAANFSSHNAITNERPEIFTKLDELGFG